ncbi:MAG: type II toxin-antitoxin system HicA family toxin [Candidatus Helarchaeota archaeon]
MVFKTRDVRGKLLNKFHFVEVDNKHKKYALYHNGKKVVLTSISHGGSEIYDGILKQMAKQVGVYQLGYFKEMILCTKSQSDYLTELRRNGFID